MKKAVFQTQKIIFALGTVCTLTAYNGESLQAFDRAKARILEIDRKVSAADNSAVTLMARGYAAEETKRILKLSGVSEALIVIGETVVNMGTPRRIGLQDPFGAAGENFSYVDIGEKAIVSAGLYQQGFAESVNYRRHGGNALAGLTLIGENAVKLSALCNSAVKLSATEAMDLLNDTDVEAIFVSRSQVVTATDGLHKRPTRRQAA